MLIPIYQPETSIFKDYIGVDCVLDVVYLIPFAYAAEKKPTFCTSLGMDFVPPGNIIHQCDHS